MDWETPLNFGLILLLIYGCIWTFRHPLDTRNRLWLRYWYYGLIVYTPFVAWMTLFGQFGVGHLYAGVQAAPALMFLWALFTFRWANRQWKKSHRIPSNPPM